MTPARWILTEQQAQDLAEHLGEILSGEARESAVVAIDFAAAYCATGVTPRTWRRMGDEKRVHMAAVEESANKLRGLLAQDWPQPGTVDVDWPALKATLGTVADAARAEAATFPRAGRGRPPDEWRDGLVSVIWSIYPPGAAKKAIGSHFETTVEMVFAILGREVEAVHGVVIAALRRQPAPPFRVAKKTK